MLELKNKSSNSGRREQKKKKKKKNEGKKIQNLHQLFSFQSCTFLSRLSNLQRESEYVSSCERMTGVEKEQKKKREKSFLN